MKKNTQIRKKAMLDFDFSSIDDEIDKSSKIQAIEVKERLDTNLAIHSGSLTLDVVILGGGYYPGRAYDLVGPESGGKCLIGTCNIPTEKGIFKIKDLVGQDTDGFIEKRIGVYTDNGIEYTSHVFCKESSLVQIIQDNGISITGSPEHPVLVFNPDLTFTWKKLIDIQEEEYVVNVLGRKQFAKQDVVINFKSNDGQLVWNNPITKDISALLGMLVSRSGFFNENNIIFIGSENQFIKIKDYVKNIFNKDIKFGTFQNKQCIIIDDENISTFLRYIGLHKTTHENWSIKAKQVPWSILQSTEPIIISFLRSYLLCDASIDQEIEIYNNSPKLSKEIQTLLFELGIFAYYTRKHNTLKKIEYVRLFIPNEYKKLVYSTFDFPKQYSLASNRTSVKTDIPYVGKFLDIPEYKEFGNIPRSLLNKVEYDATNELLKRVMTSDYYYSKVIRKRVYNSNHKVYDLTLPTSHQFIANSTIVHNTTHGNMALAQCLESIPRYSVGVYFDYEGSLDKTWFLNIANKPNEKPENIFGLRNEDSGNWIIKPRIRMYKPAFGEQGLLLMIKQLNSKPDKSLIMDEWWYTWTPVDAKVKKKTGGLLAKDIEAMLKELGIEHDKKFLKQTGLYGVKVPNNYGGCEGIYFIDSYASMTPRQTAEDDSAAMAQQGRMFGKYINQIKSLISAKGYTVIGINQIRKNPNVTYGSCFDYHTRVLMEDLSSRYIGDIVNNELYDKRVLSYNFETGKYEAKRILRGFKTPVTNKDNVVKIKYEGFDSRPYRIMTVTDNHIIFTPDGEKQVKELKVGDYILGADLTRSLSRDQLQMLYGVMIGDGEFEVALTHINIHFNHVHTQKNYFKWKLEMLGQSSNIRAKEYKTSKNEKKILYSAVSDKISIARFPKELRCKKRNQYYLSQKFINLLDIRSIAIWYMDDGFGFANSRDGYGITFSCNRFDNESRIRLADKISEILGVETRIKDNNIAIRTKNNVEKAIKLLAPYIHKEMSYKLLGLVLDNKIGTYNWKIIEDNWTRTRKLRILSIEDSVMDSGNKYDIEIEDNHNYIIGGKHGAIVHNSEYSPGGEALKHFCDLRNRISSVSNPNGGGEVEVENHGRDEYKHYIIRNKKNKITTPYGIIKGRYWTKRDGKTGCGVDPVLDTISYLNLTKQLETSRKGYIISLKDNSKVAKHLVNIKLSYEDLKRFIVNKEIDTGKKTATFDIRKHCLNQIKKGIGMKLYYENQNNLEEKQDENN